MWDFRKFYFRQKTPLKYELHSDNHVTGNSI